MGRPSRVWRAIASRCVPYSPRVTTDNPQTEICYLGPTDARAECTAKRLIIRPLTTPTAICTGTIMPTTLRAREIGNAPFAMSGQSVMKKAASKVTAVQHPTRNPHTRACLACAEVAISFSARTSSMKLRPVSTPHPIRTSAGTKLTGRFMRRPPDPLRPVRDPRDR